MHSKLNRVAIIDVGSNTIKSLVADSGNPVVPVDRHHFESRISAGINREHPALSESGMQKGLEAIEELVERVRTFSPEQIVITATSAVRDAVNRDEFVRRVFTKTGIRMNVLTGEEEALFIVRGLTQDPALQKSDSFYQADLGGGSMELIHFQRNKLDKAISLNLGAVRLTEKFIEDREAPVMPATEQAITDFLIEILSHSPFPFPAQDGPLVGTGGAMNVIRNILAIRDGQTFENYRSRLTRRDFSDFYQKIAHIPLDDRTKIPGLPRQRADIMPCALLTLMAVMDAAQTDTIIHSLYNLRFGVAAELLS